MPSLIPNICLQSSHRTNPIFAAPSSVIDLSYACFLRKCSAILAPFIKPFLHRGQLVITGICFGGPGEILGCNREGKLGRTPSPRLACTPLAYLTVPSLHRLTTGPRLVGEITDGEVTGPEGVVMVCGLASEARARVGNDRLFLFFDGRAPGDVNWRNISYLLFILAPASSFSFAFFFSSSDVSSDVYCGAPLDSEDDEDHDDSTSS